MLGRSRGREREQKDQQGGLEHRNKEVARRLKVQLARDTEGQLKTGFILH